MKLTILQGCPGSGKTTFANAQCATDPALVRINKDDLRLELLGVTKGQKRDRGVVKLSDRNVILPAQERRIHEAFAAGYSVIVDDVNIGGGHVERLTNIANTYGADVEIVPIRATLDECMSRNAARPDGERIPDQAILMWHSEMTKLYPPTFAPWTPTEGLPTCIICDLDGTAAIMGDRSPFDASRCDELDVFNPPVAAAVIAIWMASRIGAAGRPEPSPIEIVYMSGREEKDREPTQRFLNKYGYPIGPLVMRKTGDQRKDFIVKGELFDANVRGTFNVLFCLDDRQQVVDFWRSIGLTCFQVSASFD